jgi:hypothetical protein
VAIQKETASIKGLLDRVYHTGRNKDTIATVNEKFDIALNHAAWAIMMNQVSDVDHYFDDIKSYAAIFDRLREEYGTLKDTPEVVYIGVEKSERFTGVYIFLKLSALLIRPLAIKPKAITNFMVYQALHNRSGAELRDDIQPYQVLPV